MTVKTTRKDLLLGKRISRMRKKVGLTQEKLAEKINISTTHIGLVETGKRRLSLKTLQKVASAIGLKARDLLPY